jgi:hypothetical protein
MIASENSLQFALEWLKYASDPRVVSDSPNLDGKPNFVESFMGNKHDQTALSLLAKKWGLNAWRSPSQYGNFVVLALGDGAGGPYPQTMHLDRQRW